MELYGIKNINVWKTSLNITDAFGNVNNIFTKIIFLETSINCISVDLRSHRENVGSANIIWPMCHRRDRRKPAEIYGTPEIRAAIGLVSRRSSERYPVDVRYGPDNSWLCEIQFVVPGASRSTY